MSDRPRVSVVMPVYGRDDLTIAAAESILRQDFKEFEFIIVDDGSPESTFKALSSLDDPRIRLARLPANSGIAAARNVGLALCRGEYIATMDSDDLAARPRLSHQVAFLDERSDVDILGSNLIKIDGPNRVTPSYAGDDGTIKARLLLLDGSAIMHSTTMIRKSFLLRHALRYPGTPTDVDQGLWIDAMETGAKFHLIEPQLMVYRVHGSNETRRDPEGHHRRKIRLRRRLITLFFPGLTGEEAASISLAMTPNARLSREDVARFLNAAKKAATERRSIFGESRSELNRILEKYRKVAENWFDTASSETRASEPD